MANDCIAFKLDASDVTCAAVTAVTGKRLVQVTSHQTSGPLLAATAEGGNYSIGLPSASGAAGAGKAVFGVAKYDAAAGALVGVLREGIVPVTAGGTITAPCELQVTSEGKVVTHTNGVPIGFALNNATVDTDCVVLLYEGFGGSGAPLTPQTAITALTAATGTTGNTVSDVTGTFSQTVLNNNFKAIADKINAMNAAMLAAGVTA